MGFKNVCMKFKIFVCDDCKSAHQAFSHRCKSVTMSHWTKEEVNSLTAFNGGGNAVNRATMLANVPPNLMPKKGCHPTELKEFVQEAYDNKRWHDPNGQVAAKAAPAPAPAPAVGRTTSMPPAGGLQPPRGRRPWGRPPRCVPSSPGAAAPAPPRPTPPSRRGGVACASGHRVLTQACRG